jgi:hypothetical protein
VKHPNLSDGLVFTTVKEDTWHTNTMAAVDTAEVNGRCTRRFAQNVRKNAKSLLNPEMTVRYTARIAFPNARAKAAKRKDQNRDSDHFSVTK